MHHTGVTVVKAAECGAAAVAGGAGELGVIGDRNDRRGTDALVGRSAFKANTVSTRDNLPMIRCRGGAEC
jgi:hypothetical protein